MAVDDTQTQTVTDGLQYAGQVIIETADIFSKVSDIKQSILGQLHQSGTTQSIHIYEDILCPFITGVVNVEESLSLSNFLPLVGEEYIHLKIYTPTLTGEANVIDRIFYIYNILDMKDTGNSSVYYQLQFISLEAVVNANIKLSRGFEGKISDIAIQLMGEDGLGTGKKKFIEQTINRTKFVANYWSPVKCLMYIASTSINKNGSPTFLYFENRFGLNFVSLDSMYAQKHKHVFNQSIFLKSSDVNTGAAVRDINKEYEKILNVEVPRGFNYLDRADAGMYGSRILTVDPTSKQFASVAFNVLTNFSKRNHLNSWPLLSKNAVFADTQSVIYMTKSYANFNNYIDVTNTGTVQERNSSLKLTDASKIQISVLGRTDYTVGVKIFIEVPAKRPVEKKDSSADVVDVVLSGYYVIAAMNHGFTKKNHVITMELIKDSGLLNLDNRKVV